jgi:hypothetical protein
MTTDTATATTTKPTKTTKKKKKAARTRKPTGFALGWVTETAPERDDAGNEIPGTSRTCIVLLDLPPGLDDAGKRSRDAIERATKRAVYDNGMEEYGNKKLRVISFGEDFDVPFEKTTVTRLLPPEKATKVKAENGKGAVVTTEDETGEG